MKENKSTKLQCWDFLHQLIRLPEDKVLSLSKEHCREDMVWEVYHPFNKIAGSESGIRQFWFRLKNALPDLERRPYIFAGDWYKDQYWVMSFGYLFGTFTHPLLGIQPTNKIINIRIGEFYQFEEGKICRAHIHLDVPEIMAQVGLYPFRPEPGAPGPVPGPIKQNGLRLGPDDPEQKTLGIVLSMHKALHDYDGKDLNTMNHSQYWSENFLYYAPTGIGTTRGMANFRTAHQAPFLDSFPDRAGRDHYCRISDGPVACTTHWWTLKALHGGSSWLDMPATEKQLNFRVADFYCRNEQDRLHENWLMMDILDVCLQMGTDILKNRGLGL